MKYLSHQMLFHQRLHVIIFLLELIEFHLLVLLYQLKYHQHLLLHRYKQYLIHQDLANATSPTLGISAVISSVPNLVSRAIQVNSSM